MDKLEKKHFFISLFSVLLLTSCAHNYRAESIEDKMARYKLDDIEVNKTPELTPLSVKYKKTKMNKGRFPANEAPLNKYSDKRIYFFGLYDQYKKFNALVGNTHKEVQSCPSFHSSLVKNNLYKKRYPAKNFTPASKVYLSKGKQIQQKHLALFPELNLPLEMNALSPKLYNIIKNGPKDFDMAFKKVLDIHLRKTHDEILELCEYGNSSNYYKFQNLITHIKKNKNYQYKDEAMAALLKTSVFSNMALLNSFLIGPNTNRGRVPASASHKQTYNRTLPFSQYENEIFKRTRSEWSKQYYKTLKKRQKTYL